jgi:hypothetical protein
VLQISFKSYNKKTGFLLLTTKPKGKREFKNLECSINFDARCSGSNRGKGKTRACYVGLGLFNLFFFSVLLYISCVLGLRVTPRSHIGKMRRSPHKVGGLQR